MDTKEQIREMIKAQDIIRQVFVNHATKDGDIALRALDKHITRVINLIGKAGK